MKTTKLMIAGLLLALAGCGTTIEIPEPKAKTEPVVEEKQAEVKPILEKKTRFSANSEKGLDAKPRAGDGAQDCLVFEGEDVSNSCDKPIYATYCNSSGYGGKVFADPCSCDKAAEKLRVYRKETDSLGCALHLREGETRKGFAKVSPDIRYAACFKPPTDTKSGVRITGHSGGNFDHVCGD